MRIITRLLATVGFALACEGVAVAAPESQGQAQPAIWQKHHAEFDYFGVTTRYTCDGLEGKVKQILEYLGARRDVYVNATGCPRGPESLTRSAFVRVDFSTLVAASPAAGESAETVQAAWMPLVLKSQRPNFMGDGDCELIDHMKKLLTDNFSWRSKPDYNVSCPIETTQFNDYAVQGELLKASAPPRH